MIINSYHLIYTVCPEKKTKMFFNIFHKTLAISLKFGPQCSE